MNLKDLQNKTILLFGKSRAFDEEEFESQMRFHKINFVKEFSDEVVLIVDGKMMTPYEQNASDELYETKNLISISIDILDRELASHIDVDTLLMSLKLSHDKDRLKGFLKNSMISDEFFLKLLKMYSWGGEDFFDNDDNRDVTASLISRFYKNIERNHNVQYATTGIYHLILQTKDSELLESIAMLEPTKNHLKIQKALVTHENISKRVLKMFLKIDELSVKEAIAYNPHLDKSIVGELLKSKHFAQIIARNIKLDDELFNLLSKYTIILASNETLSKNMQEKLFKLNENDLNLALSSNENLDKDILISLLKLKDDSIDSRIFSNSVCSEDILTQAYKDEKNFTALSSNISTPKFILEELFSLQVDSLLKQLARNEATPVEILYQLQLDSRYERYVKENETFGKHIMGENIGWEL